MMAVINSNCLCPVGNKKKKVDGISLEHHSPSRTWGQSNGFLWLTLAVNKAQLSPCAIQRQNIMPAAKDFSFARQSVRGAVGL